MEEFSGDPVLSPYVELEQEQADEGVHQDGQGRVFQQQWVTLTASMWPTDAPRGWRVTSDRIPILAAVFCGAALVVCVLIALLVYRCCIMPRREKHYCLRKGEGGSQLPPNGTPVYPNQSAVYAEPKRGDWGYSNRIIVPNTPQGHWFYNSRVMGSGVQCTQCPNICPVPRSSSHPGSTAHDGSHQIQMAKRDGSCRRQRPNSQPIRFAACDMTSNGDISRQIPLPEISEFSPQSAQYASSSILDEVGIKDDPESSGATLKTRSLPAWVRSKPRPLSTEDDLAELYAKVNFSKKRKNRMRNDEAAIIALSKSRSQFLHKDTDSLVDNEAVIVYDERTAL